MIYDACLVGKAQEDPSAGVYSLLIQGGLFAVFRYTGDYSGLEEVFVAVYRVWLPMSGYRLRDAPAMTRLVRTGFLWVKPISEVLIPVEPIA